jgi:DNA ligase 1
MIKPMLAQNFSLHSDKIIYPAYVQPKLDGIRCIAIHKNGKCTLWSRNQKPITSVPHIIKHIESLYKDIDVVLDGELYNHKFKSNFSKIVSLVKQKEPDKDHELVQYHIYDLISDEPFISRISELEVDLPSGSLILVPTFLVANVSEVTSKFKTITSKGYEGLMIRNKDSFYTNKRSFDLQKVKEFDDAEFKIIGIKEGKGKLLGHVGSFICETSSKSRFTVKMACETSLLRKYFLDHSLWNNKFLTIQYQGLTNKEKVPRFPIGIRFRDE